MPFNFSSLLGGGGKSVISPEADIVGNTTVDDVLATQGQDSNFIADLFKDPNFIRALGEMGGKVGGQGSVGDILGTAGSTLARRKAVQGVGEGQINKSRTLQQRLMQAIQEGNLLSPKDQDDAFDDVTIGGDGSMKLNMKATPKAPGFQGEQKPLESFTSTGGDDLPDFNLASLGE